MPSRLVWSRWSVPLFHPTPRPVRSSRFLVVLFVVLCTLNNTTLSPIGWMPIPPTLRNEDELRVHMLHARCMRHAWSEQAFSLYLQEAANIQVCGRRSSGALAPQGRTDPAVPGMVGVPAPPIRNPLPTDLPQTGRGPLLETTGALLYTHLCRSTPCHRKCPTNYCRLSRGL